MVEDCCFEDSANEVVGSDWYPSFRQNVDILSATAIVRRLLDVVPIKWKMTDFISDVVAARWTSGCLHLMHHWSALCLSDSSWPNFLALSTSF